MTFIRPRPFADPDAAARKLMEIVNSVGPVQRTISSQGFQPAPHFVIEKLTLIVRFAPNGIAIPVCKSKSVYGPEGGNCNEDNKSSPHNITLVFERAMRNLMEIANSIEPGSAGVT